MNSSFKTFRVVAVSLMPQRVVFFRNSHNTQFRIVALSLTPQRAVVVFSAQYAFSIFQRNMYIPIHHTYITVRYIYLFIYF